MCCGQSFHTFAGCCVRQISSQKERAKRDASNPCLVRPSAQTFTFEVIAILSLSDSRPTFCFQTFLHRASPMLVISNVQSYLCCTLTRPVCLCFVYCLLERMAAAAAASINLLTTSRCIGIHYTRSPLPWEGFHFLRTTVPVHHSRRRSSIRHR